MATYVIKPGRIGITFPGIPIQDAQGEMLPIEMIKFFVEQALQQVKRQPVDTFKVSPEGWRYHRETIAPLFDGAPVNLQLPYEFIY